MKTLVIGASENPERYSFKAIQQLVEAGHEVKAVGLKVGNVAGIEIETGKPNFENLDTVTLYVGPANQPVFYDYILSLKPRRVIFNPGTENPELFNLLRKAGIEVEIACTLVLLATKSY
jgi:predicted CoA-binding protein